MIPREEVYLRLLEASAIGILSSTDLSTHRYPVSSMVEQVMTFTNALFSEYTARWPKPSDAVCPAGGIPVVGGPRSTAGGTGR